MVGAVTVQRVCPLCGHIALGIHAPPDNQRPHVGRGAGLHAQGHLDPQLCAHP